MLTPLPGEVAGLAVEVTSPSPSAGTTPLDPGDTTSVSGTEGEESTMISAGVSGVGGASVEGTTEPKSVRLPVLGSSAHGLHVELGVSG